MAQVNESDEAFARRLQAQELGGHIDAQTPLMMRLRPLNSVSNVAAGGTGGENPTVINARMNEVTSSLATVILILTVSVPQVLATISVLALHWNTDHACDFSHTNRWKWWAIFSAVRLLAYDIIIVMMHIARDYLQSHPPLQNKAISIRNAIDAFGLVWFVVGNMWLFGDDDNSCAHPEHSPIYNLCLSMLIISYIQICLPCIIAILLIPVFCFCMPCLIRVLARLQDPRATQGASQAAIDTLPVITVGPEHFANGEESTCPICLSDMAIGDSIRSLRCQHMFHQQCVDEWLRVNATCPTCRKRIVDDNNSESNNSTHGNHQHRGQQAEMVPLARGSGPSVP